MSAAALMARDVSGSWAEKPQIKSPGSGCPDVGSEGDETATPPDGSVSASPRSSFGSESNASSTISATTCQSAMRESFPLDAALAVRIAELLGARMDCSLAEALAETADSSTNETCFSVRLILKCLRLLRACHYASDDIEVIIAHALCYVEDVKIVSQREGVADMPIVEASYVFCVLVFLAHSHTQDQNRPLKIWHKHLFRNYCELKVLNCAVMGLMEKLRYNLRVRPRRLQLKLSSLLFGCRSEHLRARDHPEALKR